MNVLAKYGQGMTIFFFKFSFCIYIIMYIQRRATSDNVYLDPLGEIPFDVHCISCSSPVISSLSKHVSFITAIHGWQQFSY
jgi:hypothetical protein